MYTIRSIEAKLDKKNLLNSEMISLSNYFDEGKGFLESNLGNGIFKDKNKRTLYRR